MNFPKIDINTATESILKRDFAQGALDVLNAIVNQQCSSQLVAELIRREQAIGKNEDDAVSETMLHLEALGSAAPVVACVLMARLWSIAGEHFMHDVCDRIDLWISNCNSPNLLSQLKLLASSESDVDLRRHYEQWVQSKI